ncbi:MAG TPA: ACP S-malonyltransferase [Burkholderiaceae bacterium]|jgi:[acyl-carrier-protein] S-malonyltransferase|nr:ACP S-malonyltransferase [Burkholderiaceae bacterium]HRZ00825.1 ACP S-malonyltransferase [Burkholderiaceae bacterium]
MKIAFVFPGQGSQAVGMLDGFGDNPAVRGVLARADAALGEDLAGLIRSGPAESLNLTVNTQPAMLVAGLAAFEAWRAAGGAQPALMAGHSLGEYTALTAAGCLALEDAVRLVRFRAQAMQEAVPVGQGGMAAILGLDDDAVRAACDAAAQGEVVEAVNYNAPAQVVIAGARAAVERACQEAKKLGAKRAMQLPVSAPFHSSLLAPASARLRDYLANVSIAAPQVPVINNVDVRAEDSAARIRDALARQAAAPVQWVRTVLELQSRGVTHVIECGPGKVLSGLVKRIAPDLQTGSIGDAASLDETLAQLTA